MAKQPRRIWQAGETGPKKNGPDACLRRGLKVDASCKEGSLAACVPPQSHTPSKAGLGLVAASRKPYNEHATVLSTGSLGIVRPAFGLNCRHAICLGQPAYSATPRPALLGPRRAPQRRPRTAGPMCHVAGWRATRPPETTCYLGNARKRPIADLPMRVQPADFGHSPRPPSAAAPPRCQAKPRPVELLPCAGP